jgi:hypothetical protein
MPLTSNPLWWGHTALLLLPLKVMLLLLLQPHDRPLTSRRL